MLIITSPEYACLTFIDLAVLITFSISSLYLSIYILFSISMLDKAWVPWFVTISFNLWHFISFIVFLLLFSLSLTNTLLLWRFPIFIPLSQCTTTWLTKKRKRTRKVFLIESVYQCINICIYVCIDHKRTVRGVTFFLLWLGRHTTVVKTGRMRMNGSNHGMKGKPKTCGLTIHDEK